MKRDRFIFSDEMLAELHHILTFWNEKLFDEKGGFFGEVNSNNITNKEAGRGAILNARILWTYSAAYNYTREKLYLQMADHAFDYLSNYFIDKKNGGVFWELNCKGEPINTRKQGYAQAFAIYGLSEYYRITGNETSLSLAQEIFHAIENHLYHWKDGGYIEALDESWKPLSDWRLSEKDQNTPKSMNTHLHILEAYTNLYRCWKDETLKSKILELIYLFRDKILDKDRNHLQLFFDYDWSLLSQIDSYGHDIESGWLLCEAIEVIGAEELKKEFDEIALKLTNATWKEGSDIDGSIFNEKKGEELDTDKHWWPQAEAIVGYTNAWQISKDERYLNQAERVWDYVLSNMIDKQNGEWFSKIDKDGNIDANEPKASFWKCPYHNSRAMLEMVKRLQ
ncbi:MAG: AGE family epimerase/isomerase [Paludibacteraceae bacterium]|nr:AGE family epimerase/isomerase [Paludibacteraceae bacterium]